MTDDVAQDEPSSSHDNEGLANALWRGAHDRDTWILERAKHNTESQLEHYATKADMNKATGELDTKISDAKSEIIKWAIGIAVGVGLIVVVIAEIVIRLIQS